MDKSLSPLVTASRVNGYSYLIMFLIILLLDKPLIEERYKIGYVPILYLTQLMANHATTNRSQISTDNVVKAGKNIYFELRDADEVACVS